MKLDTKHFKTFSVRALRTRASALLLVVFGLLGMNGGLWMRPLLADSSKPAALTGTIAYVVDGKEIRLIEADGSNDRLNWRVPNAETDNISGVAWKPDASGLAFTSDYEQECSLRQSEVYTVHPDGSNLKRITNAPACDELGTFAKGSVTVQVQNTLNDVSIVFVYVQGAPQAKTLIVAAGGSRTITLTDVADFGAGVEQFVVVSAGLYRWINPLARADVLPGETVDAGEVQLTNANKFENWGANSPSWRRDASTIGFTVGSIGMYEISPTPANGLWGEPLPMGANAFASAMAFSPVGDDVLYVNGSMILKGMPGANPQSTELVNYEGTFAGLDWLPDGSGFVFAQFSTFVGVGNTWLYTFEGPQLTSLTELESGYAFNPAISPDGRSIVYAYAATGESVPELRIRSLDGSQDEPLGVSGTLPDWGLTAQNPEPTPEQTPGPTPNPTPGPTPGPDADKTYLPNLVR